jgi:hypothetical protein
MSNKNEISAMELALICGIFFAITTRDYFLILEYTAPKTNATTVAPVKMYVRYIIASVKRAIKPTFSSPS